MRDFFTILEQQELYIPSLHNKSQSTYKLFGNIVEFCSLDQSSKVRGRKRDLLFCNEANELTLEDWRQLILRTTGRIIIDFNPSDQFHWIYDSVIPREDSDFFQTTYLDNPFLEQSVIEEIERFKDVDENFWRVYGLGEKGVNRSAVLTHWKQVKSVPEGWKLMNCETMRHAGINRDDIVIADCAEPKSIDEIHGHGFNVFPCRKGADSIRSGLDFLRSRPLLITERSLNGIKELRNYKYKEDKNGNILNSPVDAFNHFIDASRYAITFNQTNPNFGSYALG